MRKLRVRFEYTTDAVAFTVHSNSISKVNTFCSHGHNGYEKFSFTDGSGNPVSVDPKKILYAEFS